MAWSFSCIAYVSRVIFTLKASLIVPDKSKVGSVLPNPKRLLIHVEHTLWEKFPRKTLSGPADEF